MSRYCQALVLVAAAVLIGCGGGTASLNTSLGSNGTAAPGSLSVSAPTIAFGNVAVGSSTTQTGTLTAITSAVTISSGSWSGNGFSVSGITFPLTLMRGQSAPFTVTFAPQASGAASGSISFLSNALNSPTTEALTGTGSHPFSAPGSLSVSAPTITFGNVAVGSSTTQTGTLTATTSAVTISSGSWSGNGFSVSGITFPLALMAGQSAPFTITFAPQASGSVSGGVSFLSDAANSPTKETFTGTGTKPPSPPSTHSVSLFWSPSPSTVIGYNVYRGTTSGGPYLTKLTPSPQPTTSLVDSTVMAGTTYYYVATSVDQNSVESIYSNELVATIP
jgi:hypothetical protein